MRTTLFTLFGLLTIGIMAQESPGIEWENTYGSADSEAATTVAVTDDGGYIVAGVLSAGFPDNVLRLDGQGEIIWQKNAGFTIYNIQQTSDSGFVAVGYESEDFGIIKMSSDGTTEWQVSYGGSAIDVAYQVAETSDGGFAIVGYTYSSDGDVTGFHGGVDIWVIKLYSNGDLQWQKCLGGSSSDTGKTIFSTSDNKIILGGTTYSTDGDVTTNLGVSDYWVVMLDESGTIDWEKTYGGSIDEALMSIRETNDGGFILAGYTGSNDVDVTENFGEYDIWLVKTDSNGILEWQKSFGGSEWDMALEVKENMDGFVMAGRTQSTDGDISISYGADDMWVVQTDESGNLLWEKSLGGSLNDYAQAISATQDNGVIIAGYTHSTDGDVSEQHGANDMWVIKLFGDPMSTIEANSTSIKIFPNPVNDKLFFNEQLHQIEIYTMEGKLVSKDSTTTSIQVNHLNPGVYILKGIDYQGNQIQTKFIKN